MPTIPSNLFVVVNPNHDQQACEQRETALLGGLQQIQETSYSLVRIASPGGIDYRLTITAQESEIRQLVTSIGFPRLPYQWAN